MIRVVVFCMSLVMAVDAWACSRCGFFGNRCRIPHQHHEVAAVVTAPVIQQPPISIINNYAPGNGAAATLLAPQGGSVYGLSTAVQAYSLDPAAVLRQAAELTRGAQQLADQGLKGYGQTAALALALQASRPVAQLTTDQPVQQPPQTLQIEFRDGKWQVTQPQTPQTNVAGEPAFVLDLKTGKIVKGATPNSVVPRPPKLPPPPFTPESEPTQQHVETGAFGHKFPLINKWCGECHGPNLTSPKGGVSLGGAGQDCETNLKAVAAVLLGRMPQGSQLSAEDRQGIVLELAETR